VIIAAEVVSVAESTIRRGIINERETVSLSHDGATGTAMLYKMNDVCIAMIIIIANFTANTEYTIGTVPTKYRPGTKTYQAYTSVASNSVTGYGRVSVTTGGSIQLVASTGGWQEVMATLVWTTN